MTTLPSADGIHSLVPRDRMSPGARKLRDTYALTPGAPLYQKEFGYFSLERWKTEGMPQEVPLAELFGFDPPGEHALGELGWCSLGKSLLVWQELVSCHSALLLLGARWRSQCPSC